MTAIFTVGSIVVLISSVLILKEYVRFCEYFGIILVFASTVKISLSKSDSGEVILATETELTASGTLVASLPVITERPLAATIFAFFGGIAFGARNYIRIFSRNRCTFLNISIMTGFSRAGSCHG